MKLKQVVLSLKEETELKLRRLAIQTHGGRKGSLSQTVEDALLLLEKQAKQKKALALWLALANEDKILGVGKFDREEAYS